MPVELQDTQFYIVLKKVLVSIRQINQFNIKDNLLSLQGQPTSSNFTHKRISRTMGETIKLSKQYGTEVGVGGDVDWKKGSISVTSGSQEYDLNTLLLMFLKVVIDRNKTSLL